MIVVKTKKDINYGGEGLPEGVYLAAPRGEAGGFWGMAEQDVYDNGELPPANDPDLVFLPQDSVVVQPGNVDTVEEFQDLINSLEG